MQYDLILFFNPRSIHMYTYIHMLWGKSRVKWREGKKKKEKKRPGKEKANMGKKERKNGKNLKPFFCWAAVREMFHPLAHAHRPRHVFSRFLCTVLQTFRHMVRLGKKEKHTSVIHVGIQRFIYS